MIEGKKIFFSALDWGHGHLTRSLPLLKELVAKNKVTIGVTSDTADFYSSRFPSHSLVTLPAYNVRYSARLPAWLKVLLQWPRISNVVRKENILLGRLIAKEGFDLIISDSRPGLHNSAARCIFLAHQLQLLPPFFSGIANKMYAGLINRFSEVWVPDHEGEKESLSGILSRNPLVRIPVKYIGPQSALSGPGNSRAKNSDILVLLSGPEPQRTLLEEKLCKKYLAADKKVILVRGTKSKGPSRTYTTFDLADEQMLSQLLEGAEMVICRSGYSTLMDLHYFNKKNLLLIPTPGQPEQEYLAAYWQKKFGAAVCRQEDL